MALPRVIHGLASKRAELAAELIYLESRAEYCRKGIATIDDALALWEQGKDAPIRKRRYIRKPALVPSLVRKITDALRDAGKPLMTAEIVAIVLSELEPSPEERYDLMRKVCWRLRDMRKAGHVRTAEKIGRKVLWELIS